ncbi:MAG TPA: metallophosphoesterase, partial [Candidatus Omnitrophica bacterium]|nr:metallophosphoesterase [Candidatus Omnitrophota bacterium]
GTHTHIQTADERILPEGTAYITDIGMTGAVDSVLGRRVDRVLEHFLTGMPARFGMAKENVQLQGVIVDIDENSGRACAIERIKLRLDEDR